MTNRATLFQMAGILAVSALLAAFSNAVRMDGLPLLGRGPSGESGAEGEITLDQAAALHAAQQAVFLDARSAFEFDMGHIEGALSMPPEEFADVFPSLASRLTGGQTVITYCDGPRCPLSHQLAERLRAEGVARVFVLVNGWSLWRERGLPVIRSEAASFLSSPPPNECTVCGEDK